MKNVVKFFASIIIVCFFSGIAFGYSSDGLVAYYPLNGNPNDSSGNALHGTEYNGITYVNGFVGKGASFDGTDDYIDLPDGLFNEITASAFVSYDRNYVPPAGPQQTKAVSIIDGWTIRENFMLYVLQLENDDLVFGAAFHDWDETMAVPYDLYREVHTYSNPIESNTFYHVAMTYDGDWLRLFLNGSFASEVMTDKSPYNTSNIVDLPDIRLGVNRRDNYFFGTIDEVCIYDHALSDSEIGALATVPIPGTAFLFLPALGLVGWFSRKKTGTR